MPPLSTNASLSWTLDDERRYQMMADRLASLSVTLTTSHLTSRQEAALTKCSKSAAYFVHAFGMIDDAHGQAQGMLQSFGIMPFRLWPAQVDVIHALMRERLVLILKARQLGISWLCCGYALWLCLFNPGKVVLLFSKGEAEADELTRRIQALYDRLPEWFKAACPAQVKGNTEALGWANGSRVESKAATKNAGRSFTASLLILDEFAFMLYAMQLFTAAKPVVDAGGQLIVLSTADGIGNAFHLLWTQAEQKLNQFKAIFLPYTARPGREGDWREARRGESLEPAKIEQEYPLTSTEAFIASQRARFDRAWIEAQSGNLRDSLSIPAQLQDIPGLSLYRLPEDGVIYEAAADVAEGGEDGDWDDAVVINRATLEEVASLHGQWEPDVYGGYLARLANYYNRARVTPERNNHGHALILSLTSRGVTVGRGHDGKPGWLTNTATKTPLIDGLAKALSEEAMTIRSTHALSEISIYERKANGSTGAPQGRDAFGRAYHDDAVMSRAIVVKMAQMPQRELPPEPESRTRRG